ncbi:phosphoribosylglycinamide formyltransferase [Hyphomicrobium sp.]|uniref:phosphoribosylglycinamide formyltransferase n=1 Tax=Hyphomicrobium sp. TaxID=82 RepID=UPI000F94629B|nr:phosphoribosylglycinamide formyltransferase [Hyphomicrobium sp.]RUO97271.1 MAG: phosphoribosylglycinamide formyltransferase [Hyphomicrobium sp.]
MTRKKRTAILISGRGSNMRSLVEAARAPDYPAEIALVASNRPDAEGVAWAIDQGVPTVIIDHKAYPSRADFERALQSALDTNGIELVALAGFMRLMTPDFVEYWRDRMLNIHPSLLPSFKGLNTHERAIAAGVRIAGCTVHFVRAEMDEGPIIAQAAVPVLSGDTAETLAARILKVEHRVYPAALRLVAAGEARLDGEKVLISSDVSEPDTLFAPTI